MTEIDKYEDSGVCVCGHPNDKHREFRGKTSCRKCGCKKYTPTYKDENGNFQPIPHEVGCRCAECAWERLENAERNLLNLNHRLIDVERSSTMVEYFLGATFNITPERLAKLEEIEEKERAAVQNKIKDEKIAFVQPTEHPPQSEG